MRKTMLLGLLCLLAAAVLWEGTVIRDRRSLNEDLIRLQVVGASDSAEDQAVKLKVRDAVLAAIGAAMEAAQNPEEALAFLKASLPRIQSCANETLQKLGLSERARVSLCRENFPVRHYDTFTLPSGVYESLRVIIGEGEGHNWWCVAYPSLCLPAAAEDMEAVAADAGLSRPLRGAITGEKPYVLRFYFLDLLGKLQQSLAS